MTPTAAPATQPDANGCPKCGDALCQSIAAWAAYNAAVSRNEGVREACEAVNIADRECAARGRVDWQAVCRSRDERLAMATRFKVGIVSIHLLGGMASGPWVMEIDGCAVDVDGCEHWPTADAAFAALALVRP